MLHMELPELKSSMKNKLLALALLIFGAFAHANNTELISDSVDTPDQVTVINNNFRRLYSGKLDIKPGEVIPKRDSTYTIGETGNEWLAGYFDNLVTSSITINGSLTGTWDGWIAANETFTYISATQFSVPGDRTGKYQLGDKIKLTQTSAKYFYVTASAFTTSVTTVTVTGGSDYTLANAAITSPNYSRGESPIGFPKWFNFTTTYTGWSVTPTQGAYFSIDGRVCTTIFATPSAHGTSNNTAATMTLPVAAEVDNPYTGFAFNAGTGSVGFARTLAASTTLSIFPSPAFGAWTNSSSKSWSGLVVYNIDR